MHRITAFWVHRLGWWDIFILRVFTCRGKKCSGSSGRGNTVYVLVDFSRFAIRSAGVAATEFVAAQTEHTVAMVHYQAMMGMRESDVLSAAGSLFSFWENGALAANYREG